VPLRQKIWLDTRARFKEPYFKVKVGIGRGRDGEAGEGKRRRRKGGDPRVYL